MPIPAATRLLHASSAALLVVLAVVIVVQDSGAWPYAAALAVVAVLVVTRGLTAGLDLTDEELVVHDYLVTWRVRRDQVISVERFPAIDWRTNGGTPRETVVLAFVRQAASVAAATDDDRGSARQTLRAWSEAPRP